MLNNKPKVIPPTFEEISELIEFDTASLTVKVGDSFINSVATLPKASLTRWLYSKLHAGEGAATLRKDLYQADIENEIFEGLLDDNIKIPLVRWPGYGMEYCAIGNVRICVPPDTEGSILLPRIRPNLSPGFVFYFGGNVVSQNNTEEENGIRIYIASADKDYSLSIWRRLIEKIKEFELDVSLKILSDSRSFPRSDSIVLYAKSHNNLVIEKVVETVKENKDSLAMEKYVSYLTEKVWGNVTIADQPYDSVTRKVSFGQDRCEAIAEAILDYLLTGTDFRDLLKFRLLSHRIDPYNLSKSI